MPTTSENQNGNTTNETVVRGVVERITFRNRETGYSVIQLTPNGETSTVTVVGNCLEVESGANLIARGTYSDHPKFGRQLVASAVTITDPSTPDEIERYLGSGLIKGIGEATAAKIVQELGSETLETVINNPERVAKIKGVGKHKAVLLSEAIKTQRASGEVLRFLVEHGIATNLATRIYQVYQAKTIELLSQDPYRLAREMRGIGFLTADRIALQLGIKLDSPVRLQAALVYSLEKAAEDGHTYLPTEALVTRTRALVHIDDNVDFTPAIEALRKDGTLIDREGKIILSRLDRAEEIIANFITSRLAARSTPLVSGDQIRSALKSANEELGVALSLEQSQAVHLAISNQILLITGGPGCGKTTVIRALVELSRIANKRILLAAPTGRAAQRMAQVCGLTASTIHRLLKYDPFTRRFLHGISNPLDCDILIVDESSMLDTSLASSLFMSVPKGATLVLVGDKDQLPSVGPGRVFAELLANPRLSTVALSQIFRRKEESSINVIAHSVNSGIVPSIAEPDGVTKSDSYFLPRNEPEQIAELVQRLVTEQIPKKFGINAEQIAVLTPTNRGPLGTAALNARLQRALNPKQEFSLQGQEIDLDDYQLRIGDRVCQRVNNYQIDENGVFNGDVGRVCEIDPINATLKVELWDGRIISYTSATIRQLSLAYAVTVHRSQGSEFPCVVLVLHESQYALLERQLVYTAITRAKRLLILVGSKKALATSCKRRGGSKRLTLLGERIANKLTDGLPEP